MFFIIIFFTQKKKKNVKNHGDFRENTSKIGKYGAKKVAQNQKNTCYTPKNSLNEFFNIYSFGKCHYTIICMAVGPSTKVLTQCTSKIRDF